ncbi:hypothetical protein BTL50_06120 [Bordetella holmesii]|nr:hypothetical protein H558_12285 [Bordetella holmesii H558]AOB35099.1 hypothetical protein BBB42_06050 [Bordetella holmesii]AUL19098.1 hypothetical protein BTL46_06090 [Bordetella holmesii]AUL22422.1 hypothetical protein BTL48_06125 [Bordetella holmesii]AUL25737.1 hypothetical protein BTL49_06130 [Bordetella holmesii]
MKVRASARLSLNCRGWQFNAENASGSPILAWAAGRSAVALVGEAVGDADVTPAGVASCDAGVLPASHPSPTAVARTIAPATPSQTFLLFVKAHL